MYLLSRIIFKRKPAFLGQPFRVTLSFTVSLGFMRTTLAFIHSNRSPSHHRQDAVAVVCLHQFKVHRPCRLIRSCLLQIKTTFTQESFIRQQTLGHP